MGSAQHPDPNEEVGSSRCNSPEPGDAIDEMFTGLYQRTFIVTEAFG